MSKLKRNIIQFTLFKFIKKEVLDYIEDEHDLKVCELLTTNTLRVLESRAS